MRSAGGGEMRRTPQGGKEINHPHNKTEVAEHPPM